MTGKGRPYFSQDNGLTWGRVTVPSTYNEYYNVRAVGAGSSSLGSRFYIFGDGDRVHSIGTAGETILSPAHPQGCGSYVVGSASNGEVMLSVHGDYNERQAYVCRSADGGETWTRQDIQNVQTPSTILWTGTEFVFWGNASRIYRSTDGLSWSSEAIVANNFWRFPSFGATSRSDSGTFVMINGDWRQWYEQQRFFRSEGRARWTQLPSPVFVRSAHINFLEFGYVDSSLAVSSQLQLAASHDKVSTVKGDLPCF